MSPRWLAAAVAALALALPAQAAEVGVVADVTWGQPRADVDREIELLQEAGVRWIRASVNWAGLEPDRKGDVDEWLLAEYDYAIERAHAAGLQVLMPIADGVPYWASADPEKHVDSGGERRWEVTYRPTRASDYGDAVRLVVEHFSALGVHAYQLWNEPNHPRFWPSGPSAASYLPLLREGYEAAKEADPGSTVLLGGLSKSDFYYLEDLYRLGGGDYFDAVAVQPYTYGVDPTAAWNGVHAWEDPDRISVNAFPAIREIRASMVAFGDADKDVWLTEFGYSTTTRGRRRVGRDPGRLPPQGVPLRRAVPVGEGALLVRGAEQPVLRGRGHLRGPVRARHDRLAAEAELRRAARLRARPPGRPGRPAQERPAAPARVGEARRPGHAPRPRRPRRRPRSPRGPCRRSSSSSGARRAAGCGSPACTSGRPAASA